MPKSAPPAVPVRWKLAGHRTAYVIVGLLMLMIVVFVPFAISSVIDDVVTQGNSRYVFGTPVISNSTSYSVVAVDLVGLNEWEGTVTLRISGYHACTDSCKYSDRFFFASVLLEDKTVDAVPSSDTVTFPPTVREITQTIRLPIFGDPIRYPYDNYTLGLGIIMEHVYPDGREELLDPVEADRELLFSARARIPRVAVSRPVVMNPDIVKNPENLAPYVYLYRMDFTRPGYLQILSVLLVVLVTAAAAYAVFMRPLDQLVINAGALVLGVWGIRAILLGTSVPGITLVDVALSFVILFLLIAMSLRALHYMQEPTGWYFNRLLFWRHSAAEQEPEAEDAAAVAGTGIPKLDRPADYRGPGSQPPLPPAGTSGGPGAEAKVSGGSSAS
jgi:hypothetical protein